ncbi:threonine/serine exporter family protein, partial [Salmonella enterica subsp. enterica serovar Montevideo]|nr:threonine/serine exporter family protein [Salmonella enterica subsp. enterica serovar Montevideo]
PAFSQTPTIAMAASVLLLVPGFPLINSVADMFKGHINTGLARRVIVSVDWTLLLVFMAMFIDVHLLTQLPALQGVFNQVGA